jgi:hypothetical protein
MKYFNICTQLIYTDKEGQEKKRYYQAGLLKEMPNGMKYIRLFHQPAIEFFVFEQKDPQEKGETSGMNDHAADADEIKEI